MSVVLSVGGLLAAAYAFFLAQNWLLSRADTQRINRNAESDRRRRQGR